MKLALLQFEIAFGDSDANLRTVQRLAGAAASLGATLLVLPELWSTGYDLSAADLHASETPYVLDRLAMIASEQRTYIAGSVLDRGPDGITNCMVVLSPDGKESSRYQKVHLFELMDESRYLVGGEELRVTEISGIRSGLSICYDLRFPEMFRRYALEGVELFVMSAEWPAERAAHWRVLLAARAIENQAYMVACNACGKTGGVEFAGQSAIWNPLGELVAEGGSVEEIVVGEIQPERVRETRSRMPVLHDTRPNVYGSPR